jgi:hypothetical protein
MRICRRNASFETPHGGRPSLRHLLPRDEAQRLCPHQVRRRGTSFDASTLARIEREPCTGPVLALRPLAGEVAGSGRRGRAERQHGARSPLLERVQVRVQGASVGSQAVSRAEPQTWPASLEVASFTNGDPIGDARRASVTWCARSALRLVPEAFVHCARLLREMGAAHVHLVVSPRKDFSRGHRELHVLGIAAGGRRISSWLKANTTRRTFPQ